MEKCPLPAIWGKLVAGKIPREREFELEEHLGSCSDCRARLEDVAGLKEIAFAKNSAAMAPAETASQSQGLRRAMAQLDSANSAIPNDAGISEQVSGLLQDLTHDPQLPPSNREGFIGKLGSIEIRREIGRGGMGVVYEGLDLRLNRNVAVKVMYTHRGQNELVHQRFIREAQSAAALVHENIVTVYSIDESGGTTFLVLQYVDGQSLADRLAREPNQPAKEVARLGMLVARGLTAAHARGLIHRDVKPSNILIESESDLVFVTDFGLAKSAFDNSLTSPGCLAGTPAYMSPEQANGKPLDVRSDLFSLGVVLYQMAVGQLPFSGDSPYVVLDQVRRTNPAPLRTVDPSLPESLCTVIHRLLQNRPEDRPSSAQFVAHQLECIFDGRQPPLGNESAVNSVSPPINRIFTWRSAIAILFAATLIGTVLWKVWLSPLPYSSSPAKSTWDGLQTATETPIKIVSRPNQTFLNVTEALGAAIDGDVIELTGDGIFLAQSTRIVGKSLTIRAAAGARPVVVPDFRQGQPQSCQWIETYSDLEIEGIAIDWTKVNGTAVDPTLSGRNVVILAKGKKLFLKRCLIACGALSCCIGTTAFDTNVEDSRMVANEGACVFWTVSEGGLTIRNCGFSGELACAMLFSEAGPKQQSQVVLEGNLFRTEKAIQFFFGKIPSNPVRIDSRQNVFGGPYLVSLFPIGKSTGAFNMVRGQTEPSDETTGELIDRFFRWQDNENVYSRELSYFSANYSERRAPDGPRTMHKKEMRLERWLEYVNSATATSIEAKISFVENPEDQSPFPKFGVSSFSNPTDSIPPSMQRFPGN